VGQRTNIISRSHKSGLKGLL